MKDGKFCLDHEVAVTLPRFYVELNEILEQGK